MYTFGEKLRFEREDRGLSIHSVAEILGVDHDRLLALERNDFGALPDDSAMTDCLRAYARCLEVDADLMIDDYVREREECLARLADNLPEREIEVAPAAIPSALEDPPRFPRLLAAFVIGGTLAILGAWWLLSGDGPPLTKPAAAPSAAAEIRTPALPEPPPLVETPAAIAATPRVKDPSTAAAAAVPPRRPAKRSAPVSSAPPAMSIPEFGVGTGVKNRKLVGRGERFAAGTQVWFWTHVQGGKDGDRIDHVWLWDGVETTRVSLRIGGPSWRTYSAKTLRPRSVGDWAVEARDEAGRVLARRAFACVP